MMPTDLVPAAFQAELERKSDRAIAMAEALASYKPPVKPCMVCGEREQSVHVLGGGEVCDWCAMHIPIEMLPKGWPQ